MRLLARIYTLLKVLASPSKRRTLLSFCQSIDYWKNNPEPDEQDLKITKRIVDAYSAASKGNGTGEPITDSWDSLIHGKRKRYNELVSRREIYGLACMLKNFFRNPGCDGISQPPGFNRNRWNLLENAAYVLKAYEGHEAIKKSVGEKGLTEAGIYNATGNPFAVEINGSLIHPGALYYLANVQLIIENGGLLKDDPQLIVEIGSGYGHMGYYMLRYYSDSKYLAFDLPEILLFSSYYLLREFPEKRFALYGEFDELKQVMESTDVVLLPSWCADELQDNEVDCFINTASLPEMPLTTSVAYLDLIKRATRPGGIFYSFNSWENEDEQEKKYPDIGMKELLAETKFLERFSMKAYPNPDVLEPKTDLSANRKSHIFVKNS